MHDRLDLADMAVEIGKQGVGGNDVGELALGDVAPLVAVAQAVADDHRPAALFLQGGDDVGPDEAGSAGDHDHGVFIGPPGCRRKRQGGCAAAGCSP